MQLRGTCGGAMECRSTWRTGCLPVEGPASRMGGNCWSRGPESQKASTTWLGGVSAVISSSDLDAHSFGVGRYKSNEHEGALPEPGSALESEDGVPGSGMRPLGVRVLSPATAMGAVLLLGACTGGEALKRFEFKSNAMGSQVATVNVPAGVKLSFWNSLDLSYEPGSSVVFKVSIQSQDASSPTEVECDALDPSMTVMSTTTQSQDRVNQAWKVARMRCGYGPVAEGQRLEVTVVPVLVGSVEIRRLVLELKR